MAKVLDLILTRLLIIRKNGGKGVKTICKIIDQFQNLIEGLNKGIKQCEALLKDNQTLILTIQEENSKIGESIGQAKTFGENLTKMLETSSVVSVVEPAEDGVEETTENTDSSTSPEE